jgi:hypothetical protein
MHDTPEENRVAERLNRTLQEKVHAMMHAAKLPEGLWGEALMHAVWLKNRTWTRSLPRGLTPYKMVTGESPGLCDIPIWGAVIWVHDTSNLKLRECAKEGRWVRYDLNSKGHRVYWLEKKNITVERSLTFTKEITQEILQDDEYFTINGENGEQEMEGLTQNEPLTDVEATDTLQNARQAEEAPKSVNPTLPTA